MVQELGDNLFCAVAQASNSSAGIDEAMKNTLYRYVMGIRHIRYDSEDTRPIWRSRAARLATKPDLLTINDIDLLIKAGFEPTQSPAMNIYGPDERHEGISGHIENLFYLISGAYNAAEQQYAYGNDMRIEGGPLFMMPEDYRRLSGVVGELSATALLEVAYIARVAVGKCLATVAKENVRKISSRVQAGLVDKSDGKRPNALR